MQFCKQILMPFFSAEPAHDDCFYCIATVAVLMTELELKNFPARIFDLHINVHCLERNL